MAGDQARRVLKHRDLTYLLLTTSSDARMVMLMNIDMMKIVEDRDVVEPFLERLLLRLRERHPQITMDDVTMLIEVRVPGASVDPLSPAAIRIRRLLADMDKEGVVL